MSTNKVRVKIEDYLKRSGFLNSLKIGDLTLRNLSQSPQRENELTGKLFSKGTKEQLDARVFLNNDNIVIKHIDNNGGLEPTIHVSPYSDVDMSQVW